MTTMTETKIDLDAPVWQDCGRCAGQGRIWVYSHVDAGICYDCHGARGKYTTQRKLDRNRKARERYAAKKEAERLARVAERDAKREAFVAEHRDLVDALNDMDGRFAESLREALLTYGSLTEGQVKALAKIVAETPEAVVVPEGRIEITGTVMSLKEVETYYGYSGGITLKMVVKDDRGFRVYGTVPSAIHNVEQGQRVTFTGTVERSQKDADFGFYKRPSSAKVVSDQ